MEWRIIGMEKRFIGMGGGGLSDGEKVYRRGEKKSPGLRERGRDF